MPAVCTRNRGPSRYFKCWIALSIIKANNWISYEKITINRYQPISVWSYSASESQFINNIIMIQWIYVGSSHSRKLCSTNWLDSKQLLEPSQAFAGHWRTSFDHNEGSILWSSMWLILTIILLKFNCWMHRIISGETRAWIFHRPAELGARELRIPKE